jgi:hypothetical protein
MQFLLLALVPGLALAATIPAGVSSTTTAIATPSTSSSTSEALSDVPVGMAYQDIPGEGQRIHRETMNTPPAD